MLLSKLSEYEWNASLVHSPFASFFHEMKWIKAVCKYIGGKAECFQMEDDLLVPVYHGEPWSPTFRIGSIGYGGPLPLQPMESSKKLRERIYNVQTQLETAFQMPCSAITTFPWQGWSNLVLEENETLSTTHILPLQPNQEAVFKTTLSGNVRTAVRRAEECSVRLLQPHEEEEAYELLTATQGRVGASYVTQKPFFKGLLSIGAPNVEIWGGFSPNGTLLAMSVLLCNQREGIHLFHGWNNEINKVGLNQALIWAMICSAIDKGCSSFNLGESHSETLRQAKARWGALEFPILRITPCI
ncbi:MAG: hypothetical protein S4CHLAM45_07360 [Chlamydiales bacterium]|nr:hypothetical protein [Chlamydiales bacterium]MCH9620247.1 hypothetical protein [Chlamydiales bacterium]MCH9622843.1 hypothetical protein [Chlamydiales bacterium]